MAFTITWSHPSWPSMAHLHCLRWLNIFFGRTVFTLPVKFQRTGWSQSFWLLTPLGVQTCCITVALQHSPLSVVQVLTTEQIFRWTITSHAVTMMKSSQWCEPCSVCAIIHQQILLHSHLNERITKSASHPLSLRVHPNRLHPGKAGRNYSAEHLFLKTCFAVKTDCRL